MKSPRSKMDIGLSFVKATEYISQRRKGFKHDEATALRIDQFHQMCGAQFKFLKNLQDFFDVQKRNCETENVMSDALSQFALHDFPGDGVSAKLAQEAANERKKIFEAHSEWCVGFETIVGTARDFSKELDAIKDKIDALNKQIVEVESLKKKSEKNADDSNAAAAFRDAEKEYDASVKALMQEILDTMNKKDELVGRWLEKWDVLDKRRAAKMDESKARNSFSLKKVNSSEQNAANAETKN